MKKSALLQTTDDFLRPVNKAYIVWLLMVAGGLGYIYAAGSASLASLQLFYYAILSIHIFFRLCCGGFRNLLSFDIITLLLYTFFHLGYVSLYSLGIVPYTEKVFHYDTSIVKGLFAVNLGLLGFIFGYEIRGIKFRPVAKFDGVRVPNSGWAHLGLFFMMASLLMHFAGLYFLGADIILKYGYSAIQNAEKYVPYWQNLILSKSSHVMTFGLVMYLISSALRHGKLFHSKVALITVLIFVATVILEGDRGPLLKFGLPMLLIRHYLIRPLSVKFLSVLMVAVVILFGAMAAVRTFALQPSKMLEAYQAQKEADKLPWYAPATEMGGSFLVVNIVTNDVPEKVPYWMGASWRDSLIHVVPFLQGYLVKAGLIGWGPAEWITRTYFGARASGKGFTIVAEGFLNFGFIGVLVETMAFGFFLRCLGIWFSRKPSIMWAFIMFGCFGGCIFLVRGHLNVVTSVCTQITAIAILLQIIIGDVMPAAAAKREGWLWERERMQHSSFVLGREYGATHNRTIS